MQRSITIVLFVAVAGYAQTAPPQPSQQPQAAPVMPATDAPDNGDRYAEIGRQASEAKAAYDKLNSEVGSQVDKLLKTKVCQFNKIDGLLNRLRESFDGYLKLERLYWTSWNEAESARVESQQKSLAALEADQHRALDLVDATKQDREDLQRRRSNLESSNKTDEIRAQINEIIKDLQDCETRLATAQKSYEETTAQLNNMKTSLSVRLVEIRQNIRTVDTIGLESDAAIEEKRKAAQEICNTKQPDPRTLPKGGGRGGIQN